MALPLIICRHTLNALVFSAIGYLLFLAVLCVPFFQNYAIYLHGVKLTWSKNVSVAEQWGFLRNQVTPFTLATPDGVTLHGWHILPLGLYYEHEEELVTQQSDDGLAVNNINITDRPSFRLLRDDPDALLVLYLHGAGGTLASGWRPASYRAMYAGAPAKIHTVAIDYRGFGSSSGSPTEEGLLTDAVTLAEWAMREAGIPPSRIVLFGQSLGTAVAISLAHHYATTTDGPTLFAGMVLVAPFADVELLTSTYRIAGTVPLLGVLARFPRLLAFFNTFILSKWPSRLKLAEFVAACEKSMSSSSMAMNYHITIIHAEDDYDIPWSHSDQLFWHAVNAARQPDGGGISFDELEKEKETTRAALGPAGWAVEQRTAKGVIREEIAKWGLHDRIMSYPIVSLAVLRAFQSQNENAFGHDVVPL
jgi:abhydrolase domain-containing protein 12